MTTLITGAIGEFPISDPGFPQPLAITGSPTIGAITSVGTAQVIVKAAGAVQLDPITAAGTATVLVQGQGSPTIDPVTAIGTGTAAQIPGSQDVGGDGRGRPRIFVVPRPAVHARGDVEIGPITAEGTARVAVQARGDARIGGIVARGRARVVVGAVAKVILAEFTGNIAAATRVAIEGQPGFGEIIGRGSAKVIVSAAGSVQIPPIRAEGHATVIEWSDDELAAVAFLLLAA